MSSAPIPVGFTICYLHDELHARAVACPICVEQFNADPATAYIEIALHLLAATQWPEPGTWDEHGDPDGNNPHVWFPVKRQEERHPAFSYQPILIERDDHQCTCGLWKSEHERLTRTNGWGRVPLHDAVPDPVLAEMCRRYGWSRVSVDRDATTRTTLLTCYRQCGHREQLAVTDATFDDAVDREMIMVQQLLEVGDQGPMCDCAGRRVRGERMEAAWTDGPLDPNAPTPPWSQFDPDLTRWR